MILLSLACSSPTPQDLDRPPTIEASRQTVHAGRFSLVIEGQLPAEQTETTEKSRSTTITHPRADVLWSITFKESLESGWTHEVDQGMVDFVFAQVSKGTTPVESWAVPTGVKDVQGKLMVGQTQAGKREHIAVLPVDALTLAMVTAVDRARPLPSERFAAVISSFQVERPSEAKAPPPTELELTQAAYKAEAGKRGAVSAEDLASRPSGTKTGEPGLASSCQHTPTACYETPPSPGEGAKHATSGRCMGSFSDEPCPAENRVGFCSLANGQLISVYTHDGASKNKQTLCEIVHSGTWLGLPAERPWPVNR